MKQLANQRLVHRLTSPETRGSFRDLWAVYDICFDESQAEAARIIHESPQLQSLVAVRSEEEIIAQAKQDRALLKKALYDGDWDPYLSDIRKQGAMMAMLGMPYEGLYELTASFRHALTPRLIAAYGQEPERLSAVLLALATFVDLGMSAIGRSYLDQKQALLEQSEERFDRLINADLIGFFAWDAEGVIIEANQAFRDILGYHHEPIAGRVSWDQLLPASAREQAPYRKLDEVGLLQSRELTLLHRRGREIPCLFGAAGLSSEDGGGLGFVLDLTMHKRAKELEEQNDRIAEANRLKSEFLANMSHELRTPLNAIIGFASLMYNGKIGEMAAQHKEFVGDILNGGRHLLRLINDILDLSKVEAGKMEFFPEPVDLPGVVRQVVDILKEVAHKQRVSLDIAIADELPEVCIDPVRFKQVLYNFLSNAIKFSHRDSTVWLRIAPIDGALFRLEVEDQGSGIPPEQLSLLFSEFQQLSSGQEKRHEGTGLGLALTKRIIDAMGGRVGVVSSPGKGSTFYAILPQECQPHAESAEAVKVGFSPMLHPSKDAPHILVVEDDPRERRWLINALNQAGYAVQSASTGEEAIRLARVERFDAVSLDILLPEIDGFQVLEQIRTDSLHPDVPVLILSIVADRQATSQRAIKGALRSPLQTRAVIDKTHDGVEVLIEHIHQLFQREQRE